MAEREGNFRRDQERGSARYGEGRSSAFEGDRGNERGGSRNEFGGGAQRRAEQGSTWGEERWPDQGYGQPGGGSSYVGPAGTGWHSEMAYGPSGSGSRGASSGRGSEYGGYGSLGSEYERGGENRGGENRGGENRGGEYRGGGGYRGSEFRDSERGGEYRGGEPWGRDTTGQGGMGSRGSQYGSGDWGNQGYGVAPHLLIGSGRENEAYEKRSRGPKGWQRSDERIHEDVCERLMGESGVDPSDVTVQVSAGVVTLTGSVPNRQMKYRIEELADRCPGVNDVENRIRVNRGEGMMGGTGRSGGSRGSLLGRLFGFSSGSRISDVMTRNPQVVSPDETLKRAAQLMKEHDVGSVPVCNGRQLVGMITDRDIAIRAVGEGKQADSTKVSDAMTSKVHWCYEDDEVDDVLNKMGDLQVRRIPVVDRSKQLVGIVALGDLSQHDAGEVQDTLQEISERR